MLNNAHIVWRTFFSECLLQIYWLRVFQIDRHLIAWSNLSAIVSGQFITQINSICPHTIPWKITDITLPSLPAIDENDSQDKILQLIFFDSRFLVDEINYRSRFMLYRIFIFWLTNDFETMKWFLIIKNHNSIDYPCPLILYCNPLNDEISINWIPINDLDNGDWQPTPIIIDPKTNVFGLTFGEYERKRSIAISVVCFQVKLLQTFMYLTWNNKNLKFPSFI